MDTAIEPLPDDVEALKAALLAVRAEVAAARARASDDQALIAHLKLEIQKLNRDRFGPRSERSRRLLDQMELQLEELEATATQDELLADAAAARTTTVAGFTRKRPSRKPFPEHLPRERVVVHGPVACACCGGTRLSKLGRTSPKPSRPSPAPGRSSSTCGRSSPAGIASASASPRPRST